MTRKQLAHKVACHIRTHLRENGTLLSEDDDQLIWDILSDVTRSSRAADVAACRLDRAPISALTQFVRLVRSDWALEDCQGAAV